jgi:signal transduction histidine kinase
MLVTKDGRKIEAEVVSNVYRINGETVIQCNIHDISERRKHERERSDFLAMVTHDFKSPLAIIMGYADLIASDETLDKNVHEKAAYIHKGGEKLLGMVDDFLFHVKLESGILIPKLAPLDVHEIIKEVENAFALLAARKHQVIDVKFADNLPILFLDKFLIERALSNLVQNAVNYTPHGGRIAVKAERRSGEESDFASISVTDTGHGIPADLQNKLFDKYFRSDDAKSVKGAGLGLTIVKAVAEAHRGRVELQSELGKGSTFSLVLPVGLAPGTW